MVWNINTPTLRQIISSAGHPCMTPEVSVPNLLDEETAYLVFSAVYSKNFLSLFIAFKFKGSGLYVCIPNLSEMERHESVMPW